MARRTDRINHLLREEISELLQRQIKDPRLGRFITVTKVSTSPDLHYARVNISVLGSEEDKKEVINTLRTAAHFIQRELRHRLKLRIIPDLDFRRDDTIEQGAQVLELIQKIVPVETKPEPAETAEGD